MFVLLTEWASSWSILVCALSGIVVDAWDQRSSSGILASYASVVRKELCQQSEFSLMHALIGVIVMRHHGTMDVRVSRLIQLTTM